MGPPFQVPVQIAPWLSRSTQATVFEAGTLLDEDAVDGSVVYVDADGDGYGDASAPVSACDLFKIGIGPSSSHTVGPMKAARLFVLGLQREGLEPGGTVAIMLPTCKEYLYCFYGVLLAGALPSISPSQPRKPFIQLSMCPAAPVDTWPSLLVRRFRAG